MEDRLRKYQGEDQLDLFPAERQDKWAFRVALSVILLVVIGLFSSVAFAYESKALILTKAIICNSEDELKNQIDVMSSADVNSSPMAFIEGCGSLLQPVPAIVTPYGEYENKYVVVLMATIQIPDMPIQYGYVAFRPKAPATDA